MVPSPNPPEMFYGLNFVTSMESTQETRWKRFISSLSEAERFLFPPQQFEYMMQVAEKKVLSSEKLISSEGTTRIVTGGQSPAPVTCYNTGLEAARVSSPYLCSIKTDTSFHLH